MKNILLIVVALIVSITMYSQNKAIELKIKRNDDKSLTCNYTKELPGSYTITIEVNDINNTFAPKLNYVVNNSSGSLFTLDPTDSKRSIAFSYRYKYSLGATNPKVDSLFTYVLPYKEGINLECRDLTHVNTKYLDKDDPKNYRSFVFMSDSLVTITAIRKGIVVRVENEHQIDTTQVYSYSSERNKIIVEHLDGTLARYEGFDQNKINVKLGDNVYPNTPLGETAKYDKRDKYQLRLAVYFKTQGRDKNSDDHFSDSNRKNEFINPYFLTTAGVVQLEAKKSYSAAINEAIITEEFTRKELKQRKKIEM